MPGRIEWYLTIVKSRRVTSVIVTSPDEEAAVAIVWLVSEKNILGRYRRGKVIDSIIV